MNQSTNQHTKGNTNRNSDPPPPLEQKDRIHHFRLTFNPKVTAAKQLSTKTIVQYTYKSIHKKTGSKARFFPTSKIQLPPPPIENISTDFPSTKAELLDFFQVHKTNSGRHAVIHLSFTMPGTTKTVLHDSIVNTLKQNNIWLTSDEIVTKRKMK